MWRYILDANVVVVFQKAGRLAALVVAASQVSMAMVDDVYDELTVPKPGKPATAEMREVARVFHGSVITVEAILVGSPEDRIRTSLRARGNPGLGEAASVAFAVHRHDHVVVTTDRKAVAGAAKLYAELPGEVGRIIGLHALLRTLVGRGALAVGIATEVADAAKEASNLDLPVWWQAWVAETTPSAATTGS
jgi:predicted nucleic acid-binding protein